MKKNSSILTLAILVLIVILAYPVYAADTQRIGSSTYGADASGFVPEYQYFAATSTGTINAIKVYMLNAGYVKVAIYDKGGSGYGYPNNLLAANNTGTYLGTGWQTVWLGTNVSLTSGTGYYLARVTQTGNYAALKSGTTTQRYYNSTQTYTNNFVTTPSYGTGITSYEVSIQGWALDLVVPTVTTQAVTGNGYSAPNYIATLNGNITSAGSSTPDYRGFVWSTSTHADPGNVAPASSGYSDNWTESGSFSTGAFSHQVTSFAKNTTYYVRACAHNTTGWAYGGEVNFSTLTDPTCTTDAASNITYSTARLNSTVTDNGRQLSDARFAYDNITHANFADYANITSWVTDNFSTGDHPYVDISSLNFAQTYYFRVQVANDVSTVTGSERNFQTLNSVIAPTNVTIIPYSTSASVAWTKGSGANMTMVRYKLGTYPTTNTDGDLVTLTTSNSVSVASLTPGRTYYFSLWGYTQGKYSDNYTTALGTTVAYNPSTDTANNIETPTASTTWTQTPSSAKLTTVPFHEIVEDISTSYGTPLNMVWYVIWVIIGLAGGILLYNRIGQNGQSSYNLPMVLVLEGIWFGIGAVIGLTMMWIVVFLSVTSAGFIVFGHRH